jgi:hypothetical protein
VLLYVAVGSAFGALAVAARWALRRVDGLGRVRRFPWVSVVALLCVAAGSAVPVVRHAREQHRLSAVASRLVGFPVAVHCQTFGETFTDSHGDEGYVMWGPDGVPDHRTTLSYDTCRKLSAYLGSDKSDPSLDEVVAVHVLTHESVHMAGTKSESVAECKAMQRDAALAGLLGADPLEAHSLAVRYWRDVYPGMSTDYRSVDCAPGGALDEHLAAAPW